MPKKLCVAILPQVRAATADVTPNMIADLDDLVSEAVAEVFRTMLERPIQRARNEPSALNGDMQVAGAVGFTGKLTGVIYVYTSIGFALTISSGLCGLPEEEIRDEDIVNDTMGEIANMVMGQVKSRLADRGETCALTIPSVVRGGHFDIEPVSSTTAHRVSFDCGQGNQLVVDMLIKEDE